MALLARYLCNDSVASGELDDTVVLDSSGNANHGAVLSATTPPATADIAVAGPGNNLTAALRFNGATSDVFFKSGQLGIAAYPFTFGGFCYVNFSGSGRVVTPYLNQTGGINTGGFGLRDANDDDADTTQDFIVNRAVAVLDAQINSATSGHKEYAQQWRHYAFVVNSPTSWTVYQDGIEIFNGTGLNESTIGTQDWILVGCADDARGIPSDLYAADLRAYDEALDLATIQAWYAEGFGGSQASITSPADDAIIEHDSGDAGPVVLIEYTGTDPVPTLALSGTDSSLFEFDGDYVKFSAAPDYGNPLDANADNDYQITVTAQHPTGHVSVDLTVRIVSVGPPVNTVAPVIYKVS